MVRRKITTYAMMSRRPPPPPPPPTPPPPASDGEEEVPELYYPEDEEENDRLETELQAKIDDMVWAISVPEDEEQAAIHASWRSLRMENKEAALDDELDDRLLESGLKELRDRHTMEERARGFMELERRRLLELLAEDSGRLHKIVEDDFLPAPAAARDARSGLAAPKKGANDEAGPSRRFRHGCDGPEIPWMQPRGECMVILVILQI
jgi:hypothetical protein